MLKAAIKHGAGEDKVRHRIVPPEAAAKWVEKLDEIKEEISEVLQEEKEEKHVRAPNPFLSWLVLTCHAQMRHAEMEVKKGQNMIEHEAEIFSRPARTWFQSEKEKKAAEGTAFILFSLASPFSFESRSYQQSTARNGCQQGEAKEGWE